ncbi:hypothetical protein BPOR_0131g00040 [Botrytis porri]|uniref:Uncharacterized protein n=1 Tax=Botrytis porri TaxID=87229 RepID=A0A4Z1KWP6_9HELO|nr:hypothetical protein BPOR_0131g00040 [Botrytis porri]
MVKNHFLDLILLEDANELLHVSSAQPSKGNDNGVVELKTDMYEAFNIDFNRSWRGGDHPFLHLFIGPIAVYQVRPSATAKLQFNTHGWKYSSVPSLRSMNLLRKSMAQYAAQSERLWLEPMTIEKHLDGYHKMLSDPGAKSWT